MAHPEASHPPLPSRGTASSPSAPPDDGLLHLVCVDPGTRNLAIARLEYYPLIHHLRIDCGTYDLDGRVTRSTRKGLATAWCVAHFFRSPHPTALPLMAPAHVLYIEEPTKGKFMHQLAGGLATGLFLYTGCEPNFVHPRTVKTVFRLPPGSHGENKASALRFVRDVLEKAHVPQAMREVLNDHEADAILLGLRHLRTRKLRVDTIDIAFIQE